MSLVVPPERVLRVTLLHVILFINRVSGALRNTAGAERLRASSWYRDVESNRRAGGHPDSQHLLGLALDVTGPVEVLDRFLIELRGVRLIAIDELSHVHVQLLAAGQARGEGLFA